ncbi:PAS domain S-box protein [Streptomyces sp. ms191]|uniref:PAS domain-containing protein n=1 Tax=Streptomyces sp. ms191 TaxID=1827978 RepID=UPI0011CE902F|nr:PAS domain-containing protein [Streptomyces sp. ms191]TXS16056.1 PAS domain S-box protein [Streptomyces sp. ms191]
MSRNHAPLFTLDGTGQVVRWSLGAERLFGRRDEEAVGRSVPELLSTGPPDGRWLVGRVPGGSGEPEWGVWRAGEDMGDLDEAVLDAVFDQSAVGLHVLDRDLRAVRVNPVAVGMRGVAREEIIGRPVVEVYATEGVTGVESMLREVLETGRPVRNVLVRFHPRLDPQHEHVFSTAVHRLEDGSGQPLGVVVTAVDVTDRERAQARLRLLHDVHERIGSSLDVERTARELVEVTVPGFADSALVALTDAVLRGQAPDLVTEEGAPLLRCAATGEADDSAPVTEVGTVLLPGLFGDELPKAPTLLPTGDPHGDGPVGLRLVAPLAVRGQIFGVVAFERRSTLEPFGPDDLALADGIVARTATCLENALRFTREHIVMTALQSWPLRQERTTQRAIEVAQRHRPSGRGGGSWFDVIPLPGARVALVVGQVHHAGLSAVATMSRLRTAVHSLTTLDLDPHELLARLHATTRRLAGEQGSAPRPGEPTASCTFAVWDPAEGRLDVARAGTSLFAVVRPDGSVDPEPVAEGPLLGADGPPFASATHTLPAGSTLCLASAVRDGEAGPSTEQLVDALRHPDHGPEQMADAVQHLLAPDRVLLVARTRLLPPDELREWDVPPAPSAVAQARARAAELVADWGVPVDPFDVKLVVSELVTNALRYGAAPITLRLIRSDRALICEVVDSAPTAPHLRHAKAVDEGGRGLHICATMAEGWGVRYADDTKTVWAEVALAP